MKGARGTTDYYPDEEFVKQSVFASLSSTAKSFGFNAVSPPIIEPFSLLSKKQGDEIRSQIFNLEKKGSEELALRAELTPSFARMYISMEKSLAKPVKWFAIDRMYRYERPQKGREREFYQFNVECYGSDQMASDAEIIQLAVAGLESVGVKQKMILVGVNNRAYMQRMLSKFTKNVEAVLGIIDKMLKVSEKEFRQMLSEYVKDVDSLVKILRCSDVNELDDCDELKELMTYLPKCCKLSLNTVRGLSYYTGTVFEVYDASGVGRSIAGGGRYDNLIEQFGGSKTPAVGFAIGYSTLAIFLKEKGILPAIDLGCEYYVGHMNEPLAALAVARALRDKGSSVYVNTAKKNPSNQIKDANNRSCQKFILIGSDEIESKKLSVKNLKSGKTSSLTFSGIGLGTF